MYQGNILFDTSIFSERNFTLATLVVFLTVPTSYITSMLIAKWIPQTEEEISDSQENADKYFGLLKRIIVFVFVLSDQWEAVGFLIAAKSIFRFCDLRKPTEYYWSVD